MSVESAAAAAAKRVLLEGDDSDDDFESFLNGASPEIRAQPTLQLHRTICTICTACRDVLTAVSAAAASGSPGLFERGPQPLAALAAASQRSLGTMLSVSLDDEEEEQDEDTEGTDIAFIRSVAGGAQHRRCARHARRWDCSARVCACRR
jgi:hypothetical protein